MIRGFYVCFRAQLVIGIATPHTNHSRDHILKAPLAFGVASLAVLAFACAPRPHGAGATTARNTRPQRSDRSAGTGPRIESALDVQVADSHDAVRFAFHVSNAGSAKVEMHFTSGQTHDLFVLDTLGHEVWRWSNGRLFTQLIQNKILRTDDTLRYGERWANAPRGRYVAVARLASANYPIEQRTPFVVP